MKKLIETVLERYKDRQLNLASSATRKLLAEEIEAVIGHEIGHLKHKDVHQKHFLFVHLCFPCERFVFRNE